MQPNPRNITDQLLALGIDPRLIETHQKNVRSVLNGEQDRFFHIIDTCRPNNGGIIPCVSQGDAGLAQVVSFIPAAGASSRWLAPLVPLMEALRGRDRRSVEEAINGLVDIGLADCPLPRSLAELVDFWQANRHLPSHWRSMDLLVDIDAPKALYPAVSHGPTFLQFKRAEDEALGGLAGEVFVSPPGRARDFTAKVQECVQDTALPFVAMEQGMSLATLRFDQNGEICVDAEGRISPVPAGHGSLLKLLPTVKQHFKSADTAWIRNIDNVVGTSAAVVEASKRFLGTHRVILNAVKDIRRHLATNDLSGAERVAESLLSHWPDSLWPTHKINEANETISTSPVLKLLVQLFHAPVQTAPSLNQLKEYFARPVVTMGQVPNVSRDVGGSAVFTKIDGVVQKLCLELPHASDADRKNFLADPHKATHFNPVFVAVELPSPEDLQRWHDHPFWLIAQKSWQGMNVLYQESILYEMLGSSRYTNVVFVEIPRILFNPHKALVDARGKTLKTWQ